jgi:hypothetical protein
MKSKAMILAPSHYHGTQPMWTILSGMVTTCTFRISHLWWWQDYCLSCWPHVSHPHTPLGSSEGQTHLLAITPKISNSHSTPGPSFFPNFCLAFCFLHKLLVALSITSKLLHLAFKALFTSSASTSPVPSVCHPTSSHAEPLKVHRTPPTHLHLQVFGDSPSSGIFFFSPRISQTSPNCFILNFQLIWKPFPDCRRFG